MDTGTALRVASAGQRGLATRAQLAAAGLGRGRLARAVAAGELIRIHRGVYGAEPLAPFADHLLTGSGVDASFLRSVQAAQLAVGPASVACARTAAVVWRLDMLVEPGVLELAAPRSAGRGAPGGVALSRRSAVASSAVAGLRITPVLTTLRDCARSLPLNESVAIIDSALRRRLVTLDELQICARRGSPLHRLSSWPTRCRSRCWSPRYAFCSLSTACCRPPRSTRFAAEADSSRGWTPAGLDSA
ncbi:MAG: type IV toxin-antitoxin system AbiEi family antitoxin domain-containing protein [Actinobacteria bacterium]|nr:type IV toxin-antitoxin system AbiEi family antitoxin domain-containing protein [Actinomycetota bacterium]MCA1720693.1 type IV toxin-antitoxin system AbiEi family antitoxin domain-containing protein [Actinomycetota bacterium]